MKKPSITKEKIDETTNNFFITLFYNCIKYKIDFKTHLIRITLEDEFIKNEKIYR